MNQDCLFCKMISGDIPYHEIYQDEAHLAFLSIFPNTEGVTVVIPKKHHESNAFEQSDEVLQQLIIATKKTALLLQNYYEDVDRCGMVFEGFGVNHLHAKLYPLHGTKIEKWEPIESQTNNSYFEKYPGYISSNDSNRADDEKLAKLADKIRKSA